MKKLLTLVLALAMTLSLAACGTQKDEPAAGDDGAAAEEKKLVIYSAATDAQVNAVVPLFEERYGIEVEVITGGTGELLARIDAEGDAPYCDVIFGGGESPIPSTSTYSRITSAPRMPTSSRAAATRWATAPTTIWTAPS